jgi:hypothetical protein
MCRCNMYQYYLLYHSISLCPICSLSPNTYTHRSTCISHKYLYIFIYMYKFICIYVYNYLLCVASIYEGRHTNFFFCTWFLSLNMMISTSIHLPANNILFYGWIILHCVYISHFLNTLIICRTSGLFIMFDYCEQYCSHGCASGSIVSWLPSSISPGVLSPGYMESLLLVLGEISIVVVLVYVLTDSG